MVQVLDSDLVSLLVGLSHVVPQVESGSRFRVSDFGIRVRGFDFRISDFGVRVSGLGFRVSGLRFLVEGT